MYQAEIWYANSGDDLQLMRERAIFSNITILPRQCEKKPRKMGKKRRFGYFSRFNEFLPKSPEPFLKFRLDTFENKVVFWTHGKNTKTSIFRVISNTFIFL